MPKADHVNENARQLIYVPIIHSVADMGALGEGLAEVYIKRFGRRRWQEQVALVDEFWQSVRAALDELALNYNRVDLYQDGLPVCGKEREIVTEAAAKGSENHQLLLDLMARGASLMGTEHPALLVEEYRDLKNAVANKAGGVQGKKQTDRAARGRARLAKRDAYVARRIGKLLQPGRVAILFLGMAHDIERYLPDDIITTRLHLKGPPDEPGTG